MISKNEQKFIKSLKIKKYRLREKRFVVEGAKNVLELVHSDYKIDQIIGSSSFFDEFGDQVVGLQTDTVSEKILESLSSFKSNNTCLAVANVKDHDEFRVDEKNHLFILDGISDPGNFGTIIRTLDWFGFHHLICSKNTAELYNPKVISSSMGSFTRMNVMYTDLSNFVETYNGAVVGAEMSGQNLFESFIEKPSAIVMGSESHGISDLLKTKLDYSISIPKTGDAESLNVGIATGIIAAYLRMP